MWLARFYLISLGEDLVFVFAATKLPFTTFPTLGFSFLTPVVGHTAP
jgi:hypothetical protein